MYNETTNSGVVISGKALAREVKAGLKERVKSLVEQNIRPGLAVVVVGDDPASAVYVRNKTRACARLGIDHFDYRLSAATSQQEVLKLIDALNLKPEVHGILVQLPLPTQIDADAVIAEIDPLKDVDGFHHENIGRLVAGCPRFVPCTPLGIMRMLDAIDCEIAGKRALIVGRSAIVGKPMFHLLLDRHATVTVAHSRTRDLPDLVGRADIVIAAVGRPELIKGQWLRPGSTVIDVGINRAEGGLLGDVEFESARGRVAAISPVPGGVGPMTIAMLLENTLKAAESTLEGRSSERE